MAQIVCPLVSAEDRARLEAIVADRNRARKHVARLPVAAIAKRAGVGRPVVWRWQRRFAEAGVGGLLREASRKPGKAPLGDQIVHRLWRSPAPSRLARRPTGPAARWPGQAASPCSVQRIWQAHDLQPHRIRTFKHSNDPEFATKFAAIVGLYIDPPKHALVLSINEKAHVWMAPGSQEKS